MCKICSILLFRNAYLQLMKIFIGLLCCCVIGLIGCEGNVLKKRKVSKTPSYHPFLFQHGYINDAEFPGYSFPYIFEDSMIKAMGIQEISRQFYEEADEIVMNEDQELTPFKVITYRFNQDGKLHSLEQKEYFDQRIITHFLIKYDQKNNSGEKIHFKAFNHADNDEQIQPFKLVRKGNDWSCYQNESSLHFYFVFHDEQLWKPLAVDSVCQPDEDDWIIYGSMQNPQKVFRIENLVEERDVHTYEYQNHTLIKEAWMDAPFNYTRTMEFEQGMLAGYVDSVYSAGNYISKTQHRYVLSEKLPIELLHQKEVGDSLKTLNWEKFQYTHFK